MREIKFQSIHRHYKEGDVIFSEWGPQNGLFVAPTSISGYTLEGHRQYTGLKDKNGKEIYEGDIIEIKHPYKERYYKGDIQFADGHFFATLFNFTHHDNPFDFVESIEYTEVIGNIYQNPELL